MRKNLLDTHSLTWFLEGANELSGNARKCIEQDGAINFVSVASLWEMAIKVSLGKLELKTDFNEVGNKILENGFRILPVTFEDTIILATLPFHHRDPFDRILIAQSINNELTVISKDGNMSAYDVKVQW